MIQTYSDAQEYAATQLRNAALSGSPCTPLRTGLPENDVAAAYAVQEINTCLWLAQGRRLVGRKIGLTSRSVQIQMGIDQPDYGMLFADTALLDGEPISAGRLIQPKVEAEIAFVMAHSLTMADPTLMDVLAAIAYVLPALEIVDSRIARWDIGIVDTIADNASSGLFVLGNRPVQVSEIDLELCGMVLEKNGEGVSFGAGAACLGHPMNSLVWLARKMAAVGRSLEAGDVVLSGALGPMVAALPGDRFEMRISGLGSVRTSFEPYTG